MQTFKPTGQESVNPSNPEIAKGIAAMATLLGELKEFMRVENDPINEGDFEEVVNEIVHVGEINDPRDSKKLTEDEMKQFKKTALEKMAERIEAEIKSASEKADEAKGQAEVMEESADVAEKSANEAERAKGGKLREEAEELKLDAEWFNKYEEYLRESMDDLKTFVEQREEKALENFQAIVTLARKVTKIPTINLEDIRKIEEMFQELREMSDWFLSDEMKTQLNETEYSYSDRFGPELNLVEEIDEDTSNIRQSILDNIEENY
jgi:methyl-accepting chemotaxis protein